MNNEIDDILGSVFGKAGPSGKSRAAEEAEAFLKSLGKGSDSVSKALQKQIDELESVNQTARADMKELAEHLEKDGIKGEAHPKASGSECEKKDVNLAFKKAEEAVGSQVIGQDDFLHKLFLAFKRPLVMGTEEGRPLSAVVVTGKVGTGRHSALRAVIAELGEQGMLQGSGHVALDLALYGNAGDNKLFVQDLYSAIESKAPVLVFENYDRCHKSLLNMITELVTAGKAQLGSRYALQKDMLIEVGTALVPDAVSALSCAGRYLIFVTTNDPGRIGDTMGAAFLNGVGDICATAAFSPESLTAIGEKALGELCARAQKQLEFTLSYDAALPGYFAGKFTPADGVNAIADFADRCYRVLSEHKLQTAAAALSCTAQLEGDKLCFIFGDCRVPVAEAPVENVAAREVKAQLAEIVGLKTVKDYIFSLEENYKVQQLRRQKGMKTESPSMHMIFTGNPGTGKTTIARLVSRYLKAIGVLSGGQLIEVTRADLVGRYVGHTAPLTRQVIESAIGGVLFIDEAYALYRAADDTFGLEAIDTLVKGMEDHRDNLLVILAGYSREMESFLQSNSGLISRFPNVIEFPDYTAEELLEIAKITVDTKGYVLGEGCEIPLLNAFAKRQQENSRTGGNGRMVRNLIENAILNQSKRIIAQKSARLDLLEVSDFEL